MSESPSPTVRGRTFISSCPWPTVRRWVSSGVLLVLSVISQACHRSSEERLPPIASTDRPALFQEQLVSLHHAARSEADASALNRLARFYVANGMPGEAKVVLHPLLQENGVGTETLFLQAQADLAEGNLTEAETWLAQAVQGAPKDPYLRFRLGRVRMKLGDAAAAQEDFTHVLSLISEYTPAVVSLATLQSQQGKEAQAETILREHLVAHPESASAASLLSQLLLKKGDPLAADHYRQLASAAVEPLADDTWEEYLYEQCFDPQLLTLRIQALLYGGRFDRALPLLDRARALDPGSWVTALLQGWAAAKRGELTDARRAFEEALQLSHSHERLGPFVIQALMKAGHQRDAWLLTQDCLNAAPDSAALQAVASQIAVDAIPLEDAERFLRAQLLAHPNAYQANKALARLYWQNGRERDARPFLEKAVENEGNDISSLGLLAELTLKQGDTRKALELASRGLELTRTNELPWEQFRGLFTQAGLIEAEALENAGRLEEALALFQRIEQLNTEMDAALVGIARTATSLQRFPLAIDAMNKMSAKQPANPTIVLSLGDITFMAGDAETAMKHWESASRMPIRDASLKAALNYRIQHRTLEGAP